MDWEAAEASNCTISILLTLLSTDNCEEKC